MTPCKCGHDSGLHYTSQFGHTDICSVEGCPCSPFVNERRTIIVPDAAIEAAAKELNVLGLVAPGWMPVGVARVAIEAAVPALEKHFREALAQELDEAWLAGTIHSGLDAARIVRGGAS